MVNWNFAVKGFSSYGFARLQKGLTPLKQEFGFSMI